MELDYNGKFIFKCRFSQKWMAKNSGFQWNVALRRWETDNPTLARQLYSYANPRARAALGSRHDQIQDERQRWAILQCLKQLASVCDWAEKLDGRGFAKSDTGLGHALACEEHLTSNQAAEGAKLVRIHRCQLDSGLVSLALGEKEAICV